MADPRLRGREAGALRSRRVQLGGDPADGQGARTGSSSPTRHATPGCAPSSSGRSLPAVGREPRAAHPGVVARTPGPDDRARRDGSRRRLRGPAARHGYRGDDRHPRRGSAAGSSAGASVISEPRSLRGGRRRDGGARGARARRDQGRDEGLRRRPDRGAPEGAGGRPHDPARRRRGGRRAADGEGNSGLLSAPPRGRHRDDHQRHRQRCPVLPREPRRARPRRGYARALALRDRGDHPLPVTGPDDVPGDPARRRDGWRRDPRRRAGAGDDGSENRDLGQFRDPGRFDVARVSEPAPRVRARHPDVCIGAPLARLEARSRSRRSSPARCAESAPRSRATRRGSRAGRSTCTDGPSRLPVRFEPGRRTAGRVR